MAAKPHNKTFGVSVLAVPCSLRLQSMPKQNMKTLSTVTPNSCKRWADCMSCNQQQVLRLLLLLMIMLGLGVVPL